MSSKITTISHWLVDAQELSPGDQLDIYLRDHKGPPPTWPDMRAALYAQFGEDTPIRVYKHGQRISIFIHPDEESRQHFDRRSARMVINTRTEIENGFTRDLPAPAPGSSAPPRPES